MKVAIRKAAAYTIDSRALKKTCLKVLKAEGVRRDAVLCVSTITEAEMVDMNRRFLSRGEPTDVLAFPMGEESPHGYLLGDVVICPDYIYGKREEYGIEEGAELEFVTTHGVLHLLGYSDDDEGGAMVMDRRQRELLGLAGGEEG